MEKRQNNILFIDYIPSILEGEFSLLETEFKGAYIIDPIKMLDYGNWSDFENNTSMINSIYGELFEEVVINKKTFVCYWPELEFSPSDWFDINKAVSEAGLSVSIYKAPKSLCYSEVHERVNQNWKVLAKFLIDSISEDMILNNSMEEIASFVNKKESVHLFRIKSDGIDKYTYTSFVDINSELNPCVEKTDLSLSNEYFFKSFEDMVHDVIQKIDVTKCKYKFTDRAFEKFFFTSILNECIPDNLIKNWEKGYILN